ncbi:MAG: MFS transporter [Leptolyngbyaceae cyanobacterium]
MPSILTSSPQPASPLDLRTKLGYGVGELSKEVPGGILVFFLLFFLTDVVGLSPSLAGGVLLVGKVWDAVNDPLVGWLSDRTRSRWGRRFPWMIYGAVPLGISFWMLWLTPSLAEQWQRFAYYSGALILYYTAMTAIAIPYLTLAAELTQTYDDRTQLASFKSGFSIGSSILGLVIAQVVFALVEDVARQYMLLGAICGAIAVVTVYACIWAIAPRYWQIQGDRVPAATATTVSPSIWQQLNIVFRLRPFVFVMGIYLCSWVALQVTAAVLPYFVITRMSLSENHFTQMVLAVQGTALLTMAFWGPVGQRIGKRAIYCCGIPLMIAAQVGLFFLQPEQIGWMYGLGVLAGFGLSTAYLVPWSMLPDVMDLDELQTNQRREGIFCGLMVQIQKFGTALSIFVVGRVLDASGYLTQAADDAVVRSQPESVLIAIRWLLGPIPAIVLLVGIGCAAVYPITRQVHDNMVLELSQRHAKISNE